MRLHIFIIIVGMAAATYLTRSGCLLLFSRCGVPSWLEKWLKHVPTAILTALIVPSLLLPRGTLDISAGNPYLWAGLAAGVTAFKTRNVLATMGFGMAVMFALRWFGLMG